MGKRRVLWARRALVCSLVLGPMGAMAASELAAATILVTTTVDDNAVNLNCTLREAIDARSSATGSRRG